MMSGPLEFISETPNDFQPHRTYRGPPRMLRATDSPHDRQPAVAVRLGYKPGLQLERGSGTEVRYREQFAANSLDAEVNPMRLKVPSLRPPVPPRRHWSRIPARICSNSSLATTSILE